MSHTVDVTTQITDEDCLLAALMRVENATGQAFPRSVIEIHKNAVPMNLYNDHRDVRANVIIRKDHLGYPAYNDLGFVKKADGTYQAVIADHYDQQWLGKLSTYYGVEKAKKEFKVKGIKYTESVDETGRIQLKASVSNGGIYA